MRAKKRVVLLDRKTERRRVRQFVLQQWGLAVWGSDRLPRDPDPAIHVVVLDGLGNVREARYLFPEANIVTIGGFGGDMSVARQVLDAEKSLGALIETVRTAAVRRRGPRRKRVPDSRSVIRAP